SLDISFNPGTGFNNRVFSISLLPDGRIMTGGQFTSFNGTVRNYISQLNANGSLDLSFDPGTGFNSVIQSTSIRPDGKIIVGGSFTFFNAVARNYIAQLNADGSLDTSFYSGTEFNNIIYSISIQPNDKTIVGGLFTSFNGTTINYIARILGKPLSWNSIRGNIFTDGNNDCKFQSSEKTLSSIIIKATPGPFFSNLSQNGEYWLKVDTGVATFTLTQQYNSIYSKLLKNQCAPSYNVALAGIYKDTCCFDFAD